jgi:hypothetical protein
MHRASRTRHQLQQQFLSLAAVIGTRRLNERDRPGQCGTVTPANRLGERYRIAVGRHQFSS